MALANIYWDMGFCETYPSELLHCAINFPLSNDIAMISQQIIACPVGRRVVILAGRITSNEDCHIVVCDGDFPADHHAPAPALFDSMDLPDENYLLPPTTICQPHLKTRAGRGLWFWGQTLSASSEERLVFGYLKYLLLEALPLGEPIWGEWLSCLESRVEISWLDVQGAESYTLQRLNTVGDDVLQWNTIYEGEDAFFSMAAEGGIKSYRFKAENGDESTGWSEIRQIMVKPSFSLTITLDEAQTVCSVYWGVVAGAKYFEVYRDDVLIATTNYLGMADPLVQGQTYNYLVKAYVYGNCYGEATGSLEVAGCLQPVITAFEIGIQGQMDGVPFVFIYWFADNATGYELYQDGVAIPFEGNQANPVLAFGNMYAFKLVAICGDKQAEQQTINYFVDPCYNSVKPIINSFYIDRYMGNYICFAMWSTTESMWQELWRNGELIYTGNLTGFQGQLTPGTYEYILKAFGETSSCFVTDTKNIIVPLLTLTDQNGSAYLPPLVDSNAKGVFLSWPGNIQMPLTQDYYSLLHDSNNDTISLDILRLDRIIQPTATPANGIDTYFTNSVYGNLEGALGMVIGLPSLLTSGSLTLTTQNLTYGDAWFSLVEGQGAAFLPVASTPYSFNVQNGIYHWTRSWWGEKYAIVGTREIQYLPLSTLYSQMRYFSSQICNPRNAANTAYTKPMSVTVGIFKYYDEPNGYPRLVGSVVLKEGKYFLLDGGRVSVISGYFNATDMNYINNLEGGSVQNNGLHCNIIAATFGE
jgi:hypothetical protein